MVSFTYRRMVALLSYRFPKECLLIEQLLNLRNILLQPERPGILVDRRADHGTLLRPQVLPQDRGGLLCYTK